MPFLKSLPPDTTITAIYRTRPEQYRPWMSMGRQLMHGESQLSEAEREMLGTYISALNNCKYCVSSHEPIMEKLGIDPPIIDQLLDDIDSAHIDEKLKPLFHFCRKLTLQPASMTQQDADAVIEAGWDEETLHTAVMVACRYNFLNRLALGLGLTPPDEEKARHLSEERNKVTI